MILNLRLILFLFFTFGFSSKFLSQEITEPSYKLEFLKATYEEFPNQNPYKNQTVLYFKYSKKKGDMTLVSMRIKYKTDENGEEIIENLEKSKHSMTIFGDTHTKRKPHDLYKILKDRFEFNKETEDEVVFILAFYLRDLTPTFIPKMDFAYGLWEPANEKIRIEKYFKIDIAKK